MVTFGYQSLDTLLRQGKYDTAFLTQVGEGLLDFDKNDMRKGDGWLTTDPKRDPVTGFMVALKNNPDAATAFFSGPKGKEHVSYVALEHALYDMTDGSMTTPHRVQLDAFGEAVVAATTGRVTDASMAEVVGNVMNTLGGRASGEPQEPAALQADADCRRSPGRRLVKSVLASTVLFGCGGRRRARSGLGPSCPSRGIALGGFGRRRRRFDGPRRGGDFRRGGEGDELVQALMDVVGGGGPVVGVLRQKGEDEAVERGGHVVPVFAGWGEVTPQVGVHHGDGAADVEGDVSGQEFV